MNKSHSFKEALKKQYSLIVIAILIVGAFAWKLYPVNTLNKIGVFSAIIIIVGLFTLWAVHKAGYKKLCPKCSADIFPFMEIGEASKVEIIYCPICGEKVSNGIG